MSALVHEAFVQRQHTRYKLPLDVTFAGRAHRAVDWSVAGVGIEGVEIDIGVGSVHPLLLEFPFRGFTLAVGLTGEIRHVSRQTRRAGFRFVDVTDEQVALLQFVVDAHLAGDVIDGGDVLEVVARDNRAPARRKAEVAPETPGRRARRIAARAVSYGIIAAVFAGIVGFVGANVYDRLFVVRPAMASVTGDTLVLAPGIDGRISGLAAGGGIAAGDVAFTVTGADGVETPVESPCDCRILAAEVSEGAVVRAGQTVMTLVAPDSRPAVTAALAFDDIDRLGPGTVARIRYLDGVETTVDRIRFQPALLGAGNPGAHALVELDPGRVLGPEAIGQPVSVSFDTSGLRTPTAASSDGPAP